MKRYKSIHHSPTENRSRMHVYSHKSEGNKKSIIKSVITN